MTEQTKRTWVEIEDEAFVYNMNTMRQSLPGKPMFLGVVKANAYGHGAVHVAQILENNGCDYLAVACFDEARQLREGGISLPILILGYTPSEYAADLATLDITQAVGSYTYAQQLNEKLSGGNMKLKVHLKLETGMGRTGFRAYEPDRLEDACKAVSLKNLYAEGIFTHFSVSDCGLEQKEYTNKQFERFTKAYEQIEKMTGHHFAIHHCANSGAVQAYPQYALDMVRPGVSLYGLYPGEEKNVDLHPAMTLKTRIYCIEEHFEGDSIAYGRTYTCDKPRKLAVLPIGYADGLHRTLSNKAEFWLNGQRIRQVGRICMDMCMADVTDVDCQVGDEVEIFGKNIPIEELADKAGTIHYELCCAVAPRVPRVYIK